MRRTGDVREPDQRHIMDNPKRFNFLDISQSVGNYARTLFVCKPRNDLLSGQSSNEAYCPAEPGRRYAIYFPDGGQVKLDRSAAQGSLQVRWLDINRSTWQQPQTASGGGTLELNTPGKRHWAVLVLAR